MKLRSVMSRQDLDQVSTFSEILDTLKDYPGLEQGGQVLALPSSRPGHSMADMAPLGPSQVDIGYLSDCR